MSEISVGIVMLGVVGCLILSQLIEIAFALRRIREALDGKTSGPIDREFMRKESIR